MKKQSAIKQFLFLLLILFSDQLQASAKDWRGIVPLRSTRSDVERLLGKPNELGRYQFPSEKARITYSTGGCDRKQNCECWASEGTVLSIYVVPEHTIRFSQLSISKSRYQRLQSRHDLPSATYTNEIEGVRYMVNQRLDLVENIEFLPAAKDCQELLALHAVMAPPNRWRGIRPLYSTKIDVDALLGPPKNSVAHTFIYDTGSERVDVIYASGDCKLRYEPWNVPSGTVVSIEVIPKSTKLVRDLLLDKVKYTRHQSVHPANIVDYENLDDGIVVHTIVNDGCEQVLSIIYGPGKQDANKKCRQESHANQ